jgi:hypothetical protein
MHYRVIQDAIRRTPFEPFNVVMSSGEKYEVKHPENIVLMKDAAAVPVYESYKDDGRPDRLIYASYLHISALEPVPPPPKPKSSRSRRSR